MTQRMFTLFVLAIALAIFVSAPGIAADKAAKGSHEGTFVKATSDTVFVMTGTGGKAHTHTLSADAQVTNADGKKCKITDFKKGDKIRVTTKEGDTKVAVKVEGLKAV
jgi:hypothetical protein